LESFRINRTVAYTFLLTNVHAWKFCLYSPNRFNAFHQFSKLIKVIMTIANIIQTKRIYASYISRAVKYRNCEQTSKTFLRCLMRTIFFLKCFWLQCKVKIVKNYSDLYAFLQSLRRISILISYGSNTTYDSTLSTHSKIVSIMQLLRSWRIAM
jgi:hypothetical protein